MSAADFFVLMFQVALPVMLLVWLGLAPARSVLMYVLQALTVALYIVVLCLVPLWLALPWWTPRLFLLISAACIASHVIRQKVPIKPIVPHGTFARTACVVLALLSTGLSLVAFKAFSGHRVPDNAIELAFPLESGTYLVVHGGSTATINPHLLTLDPKTDRQRNYKGQSYAVDLVALGAFGLRAPGWRPRDPGVYQIFGAPVVAPCAGKVLSVRNDKEDKLVPEMDTTHIEGNHVFLGCGDVGVLLAHMRQGSVRVSTGDQVETGDRLGEVGNSGKTGEPHLHIHAQRITSQGSLFAGEPLHITLEGKFPVRNQRIAYAGDVGSVFVRD